MTEQSPPCPPNEDRLHALVDGRLSAEQAQQLRARLSAAEQQTVLDWEEQNARLKSLHRDWADPQHLAASSHQATAEHLQDLLNRRDQWWRWSGMAAGWVLAFGLGWLTQAHAPWKQSSPGALQPVASPVATGSRFAQQAAVAHAVYQPEQRHPVEVSASQQEHLVQWLSKRLGRPLRLPALQAQGFELMGGRLLPGESGARAQFMYQNSAGIRVTLYLGSMESSTSGETAFRFHGEGPVPSFYWVDQGFGYALSGPLSRGTLLELATAVHQQL